MFNKLSHNGLRWLWISIVVLLLDRVSKYLVIDHMMPYEPYTLTSFFDLTLAYNKGAAFSFLNSASGWQSWLLGSLAIAVSVAILVKLKQLTPQQRWMGVSLALIIGGALGNLTDRLLYGHVIDFIDWHIQQYHWPVFNIADSAICIGAVMLFFEVMFIRKSN